MLGEMTMDTFLQLAFKEATYSTAFIAMPLACLVVIVFEYFQTLKSEAKFIWTTPWNNVKCLFYLNRLAPVLLLSTALCYALIETPTIKTCKTINALMCSFIGLCHLASEIILYLRVWAISGHSRKLGAFLICNAIAVLSACIALMSLYLYRGEWGAKDTITAGCITHSRGSNELPVTIIFALFLYSGLTVMVLCVYFGIRFYRDSKPGPLLVVFYRDGTVYFVVVFAMSVTSAIITTFLPKFSRFVITIPYSMIMTVICTRMVLHLRQIAQHTEQGSLENGGLPKASTAQAATLTWEVR